MSCPRTIFAVLGQYPSSWQNGAKNQGYGVYWPWRFSLSIFPLYARCTFYIERIYFMLLVLICIKLLFFLLLYFSHFHLACLHSQRDLINIIIVPASFPVSYGSIPGAHSFSMDALTFILASLASI